MAKLDSALDQKLLLCKFKITFLSIGMTPGGMTPGGMTPGGMTPGGMTPGGMTPGLGLDGGMTPAGLHHGTMTPGTSFNLNTSGTVIFGSLKTSLDCIVIVCSYNLERVEPFHLVV